MNVFVDADACPVTEQILELCKKHGIPVVLVCDETRDLCYDGVQTVRVQRGSNSADFYIVNRLSVHDIVVTQDYGLAAMALAKKARALSPNGLIFSDQNIESLLASRHFHAESRRAGYRGGRIHKRTAHENASFLIAFESMILVP